MSLSAIDISTAGMRVQRARMDLIAANIANADTSSVREVLQHRSEDGQSFIRHEPYRRKTALLLEGAGGVPVLKIIEDPSDFRSEVQPEHPHAVPSSSGAPDAGKVYLPNVNPMTEMVDLLAASRAYEANLTAVEVAKAMNQSSLRILG